jgi:signal peptidase I
MLTGTAIGVIVCLAGLFTVRAAVAEVFYIPMASLEPELPQGSRVLVYKLGDTYQPGQIVVYDTGLQKHVGRVDAVDMDRRRLEVSRNGVMYIPIDMEDIIGRVVLTTR